MSMKPVLDGYEFYERIGMGTFGKVYRAKNIRTQEICAIKVISLENATSRTLTCLSREILTLRSVSHENIVRLLDVASSSKSKFLILEYCNGGDLYSYLKSRERLTESFVQKVIQQLVKGMNQLHELSYIHRDIKLANVFLSFNSGDNENVKVKLGDLGLAREMNLGDILVDPNTPLNMSIVGTLPNMAPEIINRLPYSFTVDIWSLGLFTYELVCGKECFNGKTKNELNRSISTGIYRIPKSISKGCIDFISRCLIEDPKERIKWEEVLNHPFVKGELRDGSIGKGLIGEDEDHYIMTTKRITLNCKPTFTDSEYEIIDVETWSKEDNNFVII